MGCRILHPATNYVSLCPGKEKKQPLYEYQNEFQKRLALTAPAFYTAGRLKCYKDK